MQIKCDSAEIKTSHYSSQITVDITNIDTIETDTRREEDFLLDYIGKDRAMEYFGLVDKED